MTDAVIAPTAGDGVDPRKPPIPEQGAKRLGALDGTEMVLLTKLGDRGTYYAPVSEIGGGGAPSNNGMVKLASGMISSPLDHIDLALPSDYVQFKLEIFDLVFSTKDSLAMAMSADGGTTFLNDANNFDSYQAVWDQIVWDHSPTISGPSAVQGKDSLMSVSGSASSSDLPVLAHATIYPGSAASYTQVLFQASTNETVLVAMRGWGYINPAATVTPTKQRMNLLRLQPYGNGDCNPATGTTTMTAGTYVFWGIKL